MKLVISLLINHYIVPITHQNIDDDRQQEFVRMRFEANRSLNTVGSHTLLAPLRSQHSKKHSSSADWSNSLIYVFEFPYSVQKVQFGPSVHFIYMHSGKAELPWSQKFFLIFLLFAKRSNTSRGRREGKQSPLHQFPDA